MSSPAPKSPEQSEKSKKYDRQLRLWGDHGQAALESAHVCLINATGLGTEILKSLVLPGVGAFTIVDGRKVTEEDIGCNFFLDVETCGKSRAQITTQLLLELNPDVRGDYVDESIEQLLENNPDFFNNFAVVIGTSMTERTLIPLSKKLWDLEIPFIVCRSYGFIGYVRVQVAEHTVVETHPDNQIPDLRLDRPFPSLKKHVDSIDLEAMEYKEHAHVPYIIILYKYQQKWKEAHDGQLPKNYKEKEVLKSMIRKGILLDEHGNPEAEENFEEAIKAVTTTVVPTKVPSHVREILDDSSCMNLTSKSKPFWIMAKAVRDFVENEGEGCLPLRGSIPDMTAETEKYIALQQVYHNQATKDAEIVFRRVQQLLHQLNQPADTISETEVKLFCKHASSLHLVRGSSIADEYDPKSPSAQAINCCLQWNQADHEGACGTCPSYRSAFLHQLAREGKLISAVGKDKPLFNILPITWWAAALYACRLVSLLIAGNLENPDSTMVYYVMLRGVDRFHSEYNMYPGEFDDQVEPDIVKLKACISKLLNEWGCGPLAKDDYVHELCRYGGAELHSVSAFVGGCAAHETIKFITSQYKPLNNTFIYDGITSNTATYIF